MLRETLAVAALCVCTGCAGDDSGGGGGGGATTPSATVSSITVSYPGGPIYIGAQTQFQATTTMSDGTTQPAMNATWGSENPEVAAVSSAGLVNPLKAGEATIFAGVSPRGSLRIRVYPNFGGTWSGTAVVVNCEAAGVFVGAICVDDAFSAGDIFMHNSKLIQTNDAVDAEIMFGDGTTARTSGTITVDGELQLPAGTLLPPIESAETQIRTWRSRADQPSRMTGTYQLHVTIPGYTGSATISFRLENVIKAGTPAALTPKRNDELQESLRRAFAAMARR